LIDGFPLDHWTGSHSNEHKAIEVATMVSMKLLSPRDTDIILGKGGTGRYHPGNIFLRQQLTLLKSREGCIGDIYSTENNRIWQTFLQEGRGVTTQVQNCGVG